MTKRARTNKKRRLLLVVAAVLAVACITLYFLEKAHVTSLFSSPTQPTEKAQTTSTLPSAQSDYTNDSATEENKDAGNTMRENQGTATVTDNNNGVPSSNTSEPKTSPTGEIVVYLPFKNSVIKSGQEFSGTSLLPTVHYRLIDSISGVIATGSLNVVNGSFSGVLSFDTNANEGRIDIFGTRADASEYSNVEIPVRFK